MARFGDYAGLMDEGLVVLKRAGATALEVGMEALVVEKSVSAWRQGDGEPFARPLRLAVAMARRGERGVLDAMASDAGMLLVPAPRREGPAEVFDVRAAAGLLREAAEVAEAMGQALSDGEVSPEELERVRGEVQGLLRCALGMQALVEDVARRQGPG